MVNVFLEVEENNISAVRLYEGAGYAHTGRRKNYYQNEAGRRDALLYHRSLLVMGKVMLLKQLCPPSNRLDFNLSFFV